MRYVLLLYGEEPAIEPTKEESEAEMAAWWEYDTAMAKAGVKLGGEALQPSQTTTTVRLKGDQRVVTDGPFAETREVLGGYYVIDAPDLDTALDWAAKSPAVTSGSVEVRPIWEIEGMS